MIAPLISFFASFAVCLLLIRYQHMHAEFTMDSDLLGIQKFHQIPTSRVGGVAIFFGLGASILVITDDEFSMRLLISSSPVFFIGLLEDITKKISVKVRLLIVALSALFCGYLFNTWLTNIEIFGLDFLLQTPILAILFTCFCVTGVANSFNLIDGYHGLSSFVSMMIFIALAYVALEVGDLAIFSSSSAMIGAIAGFFIWNYPKGRIFQGDGGAYLTGFLIAELSLLLVTRNPQVSKWFPLLLCFYPIFETIFTLYRRVIIRKASPTLPDATHLHQIIYRRVVSWPPDGKWWLYLSSKNAMTSPYLWTISFMSILPAVLFWKYHIALKLSAIGFAAIYIWLYWSIVRFKTPFFIKKIKRLNPNISNETGQHNSQ